MHYDIVRWRTQGQSWAYGGTPAVVSRYGSLEPAVELWQSDFPVERDRICARAVPAVPSSS